MPALRTVYEEMDKEQYAIIGVNITTSDTPEDAAAFVAYYGIEFPMLLDSDNAVTELYGVRGVPTNLFIGSDGIITERVMGGLEAADLMEKLEAGVK